LIFLLKNRKGTASLQGDELTFTFADGKEIERYKREK